jgi:dienelactone hydrolase
MTAFRCDFANRLRARPIASCPRLLYRVNGALWVPSMKTKSSALVFFIAALPICGAEVSPVESLLKRPIITTNSPLEDVQAYTENRVPIMPLVQTAAEWERIAERLRRDTLAHVVFRGQADEWRKGKVNVVWLETIEGGPGYRIKKLRYEAVPGLWIPALLYEPEHLSGKVPVALSVNGHEGIGKSVAYKQIRCINLAKRGMLVLNPEWLGMGQLNGADYQHSRMNQLDLCGTSGVSPFYLAMSRGLDVLLSLKNADAKRVAVSGLSGGGWQTIFISSLDPRVTLSNPVAGYSSLRTRARFLEDLGDSEQTPCDLATVADYAHLTAMRAPRPTLLTFNAKDDCCFGSGHALAPLIEAAGPIFKLYDKANFLRSHVNYDPGTHNFGLDNREAFYRLVGEHFYAGSSDFSSTEIPVESEVKAHTNLLVALPPDNATFNSLALALSKSLPRQPALPGTKAAAEKWQEENRTKLREVVRAKQSRVTAEKAGEDARAGVNANFWRLRVDEAWTVPAVEMTRGEPKGTTILLADGGRQSVSEEAERRLAAGQRVLVVDLFYFGESRIRTHDYLFALLVAAVGDRPLGIQASQLAAIARWSRAVYSGEPVSVIALGPRSSTIALVAAGLEEQAIASLEIHDPLGSLKEVIEQNWKFDQKPELFCFGLLEAFDIKHLLALVAPRPVAVIQASDRAKTELNVMGQWSATLGAAVPGVR